jgi:molybdopterin molybdotransferase
VTATLIDPQAARRLVLDAAHPLAPEPVALDAALGRVLAQDVVSGESVPGFDNSAMDGYAVIASDTALPPVRLRVVGESRAGAPLAHAVGRGEAAAISTGAVMPAGADAVARVEEVVVDGEEVELSGSVAPGLFVRRAGDDVRAGAVALGAGARLGPFELGVLASIGCPEVSCVRAPTVALVVTGDELLDPGEPLRPGAVRDTHSHTLPPLVRAAGGRLISLERVGDDPVATREALARALGCDVVVSCGGVSVGAHDHVRGALAALGVEERFRGVSLRPGKPTWFGVAGGPLVFALPGNAVSAVVTFVLFVRPALRALSGDDPAAQRAIALLDEAVSRERGRTHAVRCRLRLADDGWHARATGPQGSHLLGSTLGADCLAMIGPGEGEAPIGDRVEVELI